MNAVFASSDTHGARHIAWISLLWIFSAIRHIVRLVLYAVLATLEPIVRIVLSFAALGMSLTIALFYFAGPHGVKVSYGILIPIAIGAAVLLTLYELALRALEP